MQGLEDHCKDLAFYSDCKGKLLEILNSKVNTPENFIFNNILKVKLTYIKLHIFKMYNLISLT